MVIIATSDQDAIVDQTGNKQGPHLAPDSHDANKDDGRAI